MRLKFSGGKGRQKCRACAYLRETVSGPKALSRPLSIVCRALSCQFARIAIMQDTAPKYRFAMLTMLTVASPGRLELVWRSLRGLNFLKRSASEH